MQLRDQTFMKLMWPLFFMYKKNYPYKCWAQSNSGKRELSLVTCMMLLSFALVHIHVSVVLVLVKFAPGCALLGAFEPKKK